MANATFGSLQGTQTGNFNIGVSFGDAGQPLIIVGLEKTDFNLRALTENGITGIGFTIIGAEPNANFNLAFTIPQNVEGSFEVSLVGQVTRQGGSSPEAVMAASVVVVYDTTANIDATFGTVEYRDGGVIVVPVSFGEAVIAPSKSVFPVSYVSGDALTGVKYILLGSGTEFELQFFMPADRKGSFKIGVRGKVLKPSGVWDDVVIQQTTPPDADLMLNSDTRLYEKTVRYSTIVPELKNFNIPANYTPGEKFDVLLQFTSEVTLNNPVTYFGYDEATYLDFFIFEGAKLGGPPNIYRKTDNDFPEDPITISADLTSSTEWTDQDMQTVEATIYLLRWNEVSETARGIFNMTMKPGFVRGPVS